MLEAQHRFRDGAGLRSRQAHNAEATASSRGGNGDDGVVKVHARIVAGKTGRDQRGALVLATRQNERNGPTGLGMREVWLPEMVTGSRVSVGRPMGMCAKEALNNAYLVGQHEAEGQADQPGYHREAMTETFEAISHEPKGRGDAHRD